jgi:hypothetical protein
MRTNGTEWSLSPNAETRAHLWSRDVLLALQSTREMFVVNK